MSRVGKNPVTIPSGVTVEVRAGTVHAKGKLGALALAVPDIVETGVEDGHFWVTPANDTKEARLMWGTVRNTVRNMVKGVSEGYSKALEINGVGYRAGAAQAVMIPQHPRHDDPGYRAPNMREAHLLGRLEWPEHDVNARSFLHLR